MKTVTHEGKVYEIGALYMFKIGGKEMPGLLTKIHQLKGHAEFHAEGIIGESVVSFAGEIGTIEDAPIELESGHCYYCEINQNTEKPEYATMFFLGGEWYWDSELSDVCKDFAPRYIKPLYKMVRVS